MKKEFVTLSTSSADESYYSRSFSSKKMALLGTFFTFEYDLYKYDELIEWACDPEFYYTHGNITFLEKINGKMTIGDLYDEDSPSRKFILSAEKFIKLLDDWKNVASKRPKEIIITKKGDEVTVEGRN